MYWVEVKTDHLVLGTISRQIIMVDKSIQENILLKMVRDSLVD